MATLPTPIPIARRILLRGAGAALVAALGGCGFALRGAYRFGFESLRFAGSEASPVSLALGRSLAGAGVRVLRSGTPADPEGDTGQVVLTVLTDQRERAVVGQTAAGQVRELQLRTRFRFRLANAAGKVLLSDTELLLDSDISFTESAVLSKEAEEALLFRDMQNDIVQQVMRRLAMVTL